MEAKKKRKMPKWLPWLLILAAAAAFGYWYFAIR